MEKLKKPKFFTTPVWANASTIWGIITSYSVKDRISDFWSTIIVVGLISLFFLVNIIKYIVNWHKFYKNYLTFIKEYEELSNRHLALAEQFKEKLEIISSREKLIVEYQHTLVKISDNISQGILPVTDYEKEYLQNLYTIILKDLQHLYNLEGGKENG